MSKKFLSGINVTGTATLNTVADAGSNTDKFLVLDSSNNVSYRTAAELYADLGIGSTAAAYTSTLKHEVKASQTISKGQAVYVSSADGTNMIVSKASNVSEQYSSKTMGLLETSLVANGKGNVITEGLLSGLNTNGANAGDPVWLGVDGALIFGLANKPYAPAHLVFIGIVTRANANNGEIFVKVQNGFEMNELHNYQEGSVQNNQVIVYESSTSLYKPKTIPTILGYTPVPDSRTITINGTSYDLSANRSWTITTDASARSILRYVATASQTTFTISGGYTPGLTDVYRNGVKLDNSTDFTATNGTTIVLTNGASVNDVIEVYRYQTAFLANNALRTVTEFIATAGQTTFSVTYNSGLVDVFYNGSKLVSSEFTAGNGTTIVLNFPCNLNDSVAVHAYSYAVGAFTGQAQLNGTGLVRMSGTTVSYDNATYATQSYVTTAVANLVNSAPSTLDTLNELATALGNDANFATTVTTSIGTKQSQLNGTGFVKVSGTTVSYDNSTYLTTSSASSTYLPLSGGNISGNFTIGNPSSALAQLHVYNASAAASFLLQTNSSTAYSEIAVRNFNQTSTSYFRQYSSSATGTDFGVSRVNLAAFFSNYAGNFAIGTQNGGDLIFGTANTERMRITASTGAATFSSNLSVNGSLTKITPTGVDGVYDNFIKYIYSGDVDARPNRWNGIDSSVTAGVAGANVLRFRVYQGSSAQDQPPLTVMEMAGNGWISMYNRLNIEFNGAILNLRNQSTGLNANYQMGNNLTSNGAGMALFGSGFTTSGQYRQAGAYFYSNQAGGVTIHAEGSNSIFLATNSSTAIFIDSSQRVGIGISNQLGTSKLSLGTGIGPKFLVYDNGSSVFAGLGQDIAAGNSTDLFCHGVSNLGFLTFGRLGTNGSSYTEWARFDTSGNFNMNGGQIRQGGVGIVQIVPIGPNRNNISYSGTINGQYTIGNTGIPSNARWLLADVFITANISDHQNFMLTRQNFGTQKNWVDTRGNNPDSEFGNITQDDVAFLTYNGEADGYTPNYGIWKSSVLIPSSGRNIWINNHGNSASSGYILFVVRGYSL